jgi:CheY-like chemotaxis protein
MTNTQTQSLLIVEDSDEDFEAFGRILRRLSVDIPLHRCTTGDEALEFLGQGISQTSRYARTIRKQYPKIILLDLNLPGTDGREVLGQIKQDKTLKAIPVIVFTTSSNPKDIEICYQHGVSGYIVKPIDVNKLARAVQVFVDYWFEVSELPGEDRKRS